MVKRLPMYLGWAFAACLSCFSVTALAERAAHCQLSPDGSDRATRCRDAATGTDPCRVANGQPVRCPRPEKQPARIQQLLRDDHVQVPA